MKGVHILEYSYEEQLSMIHLVEQLARKYTSGDSSSIRYETAQTLLEAVQYTIKLSFNYSSNDNSHLLNTSNIDTLYETGKQILQTLIKESLDNYLLLMENFDDYGISNYKNTVVEGLKAFFSVYDYQFQPQNHILTLDYPLLNDQHNYSGILRIKHYIEGIMLESEFLKYFPREFIQSRIKGTMPVGQPIFMDNLCYPVLLSVISSLLISKPIDTFRFTHRDIEQLRLLLSTLNKETLEISLQEKLLQVLNILNQKVAYPYFEPSMHDFSIRLMTSYNSQSLDRLLYTKYENFN